MGGIDHDPVGQKNIKSMNDQRCQGALQVAETTWNRSDTRARGRLSGALGREKKKKEQMKGEMGGVDSSGTVQKGAGRFPKLRGRRERVEDQ